MSKTVEKHLRIVAKVRSEIVGGKYPPDSRLPTSRELAARFKASSVTVNHALQVLIADGFIRTNGRHGTFVVSNPPHLFRYGLVCFEGAAEKNRFFRSLQAEAERYKRPQLRRVVSYLGLDLKNEYESYERLLADVQAERLAGLFFTVPPFKLADTPILTAPRLPRVAIMSKGPHFPDMPRIAMDNRCFVDKALQYLDGCGCRRPAILGSSAFLQGHLGDLGAALEHHGLHVPDHHLQSVHLDAAPAADNLVQLLFHRDFPDRPDALFILDDNLLHAAVDGLRAAGCSPDEVQVISHANFPIDDRPDFPVKLLGYDVGSIVRRAIEIIDLQRHGETVPLVHSFEPYFDHELGS